MAITHFTHKGLKRLYQENDARGVPAAIADKLRRMLGALDTATTPDDMGLYPGWRLHPLKGTLNGFWSITVTGNWRLIFKFERDNATDVDLVDYH
jgi:proteic killer suppression protein